MNRGDMSISGRRALEEEVVASLPRRRWAVLVLFATAVGVVAATGCSTSTSGGHQVLSGVVPEMADVAQVRYHRPAPTVLADGQVRVLMDRGCRLGGLNDQARRTELVADGAALIARESGRRVDMIGLAPPEVTIEEDGAAAGAPRGMAQLIPTTFARNHVEGTFWNIYDPLSGAAALCRYLNQQPTPAGSQTGPSSGPAEATEANKE